MSARSNMHHDPIHAAALRSRRRRFPRASRLVAVAGLLLGAAWATGCAPGPEVKPDILQVERARGRELMKGGPGDEAVAAAYDRAVEAYVRGYAGASVEVWLAGIVQNLTGDPRLVRYVTLHGSKYASDNDALGCVFSLSAPRPELPAESATGARLFMLAAIAPAGTPPERARELLDRFTGAEGEGYVRFQQFAVLLLSAFTRLELPATLQGRGPRLLRGMYREQVAAQTFDDLFARRAAMLMAFGAVPEAESRRWTDIIVAAQREHGLWEDEKPVVAKFEGEDITIVPTVGQTSASCMLALACRILRPKSPMSPWGAPIPLDVEDAVLPDLAALRAASDMTTGIPAPLPPGEWGRLPAESPGTIPVAPDARFDGPGPMAPPPQPESFVATAPAVSEDTASSDEAGSDTRVASRATTETALSHSSPEATPAPTKLPRKLQAIQDRLAPGSAPGASAPSAP